MTAVRERNADAFEQVFDAYHRLVYGVALRVLEDRAAAEDITQSVFLQLWRAPEAFHGGNLAGWLVRVTRNRALDQLRARRPQQPLDDLRSSQDGQAVDEAAFGKLDGERVRRALAALPDEQRRSIELGFFGGLTHTEIAAKTGAPLGTVKTRIRAGLQRLRTQLGQTVNR